MRIGGKESWHTSTEKEGVSMSEETELEQQQSEEITLPIDWHLPGGMHMTSLEIAGPLPGGKQLTRPLKVTIAYDDGEVVVSEPDFHIHAVGATRLEALKEFRRILSEELDDLTSDEEELGPRLQRELQYLRDLIRMA